MSSAEYMYQMMKFNKFSLPPEVGGGEGPSAAPPPSPFPPPPVPSLALAGRGFLLP